MISLIVVHEDINFIGRIQSAVKAMDNIDISSFDSSNEACDYIENNQVDVAVLSLSLPIMNGDEIADIIFSTNPSVKLCFIFDETTFELAIDNFNRYLGSKIYDKNKFIPDDFIKSLSILIENYEAEDKLRTKIDSYREKEKTYKNTMLEMSSLLNSRISCYSRVSKVYSKSIEELCTDIEEHTRIKIENFFNCVFGQFIQDVLVESVDFKKAIDELNESINNKDKQRHYQFIYDCDTPSVNIKENIIFSAHFLSHLFAEFLEKFRVKLELKEGPKVYRLDVLVDTRFGNISTGLLDLLSSAAKASLESICYKLEHISKDGIIQIRLYYLKDGKET